MTRFLLCLSLVLAGELLAPSRSWSEPERPVYDVPEYENSGDDDEPHVEGEVILQRAVGRRVDHVPTPRPAHPNDQSSTFGQWINALFERITAFRIRHHELPRP